ncbi:MAG TPA: hypothetical protein VMV20_07105, partial [Chitinophagaceae bacterium]|nr:hypothetical protein [Chitinophagaceae bacterium]
MALLISLSCKAQTELEANSSLTGETGGSSYSLPDFSIRFSSPFSLPINPNSQMTQDYLELQGRTSMFHSGIIVTPLVNSYEPENTLGVVL